MHLVACQLDDFARLADAKAHQRRAIEGHADVTGELIRVNNGDQEVARLDGRITSISAAFTTKNGTFVGRFRSTLPRA